MDPTELLGNSPTPGAPSSVELCPHIFVAKLMLVPEVASTKQDKFATTEGQARQGEEPTTEPTKTKEETTNRDEEEIDRVKAPGNTTNFEDEEGQCFPHIARCG